MDEPIMTEKPTDKYLSIQSVSETLGCTDKYIYFLIQQGFLKAIKLGERALRVSQQSLVAFISARTVNPEDYFAPEESPAKDPQMQNTKVAKSNWMNR